MNKLANKTRLCIFFGIELYLKSNASNTLEGFYYYPFGMLMNGRSYSAQSAYRYGFNGKENDNEIKEEGNQQDYGMRIYDPRLGKFLSIDPLTSHFAYYSPYQYAGNKPIWCIDLDGAEDLPYVWQIRQRSDEQTSTPEQKKKMAEVERKVSLAATLIVAVGADLLFTKGWCTRTVMTLYTYTQVANSIEHNRATTPEGEKAQKERTNMARKDALLAVGSEITLGRIIPASKPMLSTIEEDGYAVVRDQSGNVAGRGWLSTDGELNMVIKTKGTDLEGRGSDVFHTLYDYVETNFDKIKSIRGRWETGQYGTNLDQFNAYIKEGYSESEAALKTFTGNNAKSLGFKNVKVLSSSQKNSSGVYTAVDVIFSK